jgi:DNA invertase Pin-like site-specific DNA recombinase
VILVGYARISTSGQDLGLQGEALTAAGCTRIFSETASGALGERPELDRLLDYTRTGGTVVCGSVTGSAAPSNT